MIGAYALLMWLGLSIDTLIVLFGLFVAGTMLLVKRRHEANQRENDNTVLLDDHSH